ncbi:MAG: histidinol dehydrogenase [Deltaproteobacteria bacterium]|nr:histidinol dehydrogenase [Deltaproteobacteria bacterium]
MKIIKLNSADDSKNIDALDKGNLAVSKLCDSLLDFLLILDSGSRVDKGSLEIDKKVTEILSQVLQRQDAAVINYTKKFDGVDVTGRIEVSKQDIDAALNSISKEDRALLELAASRIEAFHKKQIQDSWSMTEADGTVMGMRVTPFARAGIYVPGGKAVYPSSVLMNAIPAKVAGVGMIAMVTPPGKDGINPYVLAAAKIAGVDRVFRVGGAQAIAALAHGTETIPKVDKITGPGNIYVATAKRFVYGTVDIDMIAGPSEIMIIDDGKGDPLWLAYDLLAQAEHDELASSILITTSEEMAVAVNEQIEKIMQKFKRRAIAKASLNSFGRIGVVETLKQAAQLSNYLAPEHLELFVEKPEELMEQITNAGAIFLGRNTPVAAGDYLAGPNHTLPTSTTARFSSPLGVEDFIKRTSFMNFSSAAINKHARNIKRFADIEGLEAHGLSADVRRSGKS